MLRYNNYCHLEVRKLTEIKILDNNKSYLLGFLQSDGHRSAANQNSIQIEISLRDKDILDKIKQVFSLSVDVRQRTRDTNFKKNYTSCGLTINGKYISDIIDFIPFGKKSEIVQPPVGVQYSEIDYWRGFIDGDGSLGYRTSSKNKIKKPFLSLCTSSEYIARSFEKFLFVHTYSKNKNNRNKRDKQFNITVGGYYCQQIIKKLYDADNSLFLDRKMCDAKLILNDSKVLLNRISIPFSREEDCILLSHFSNNQELFSKLPNRYPSVIKNRLKYLLSRNIDNPNKLFNLSYFV